MFYKRALWKFVFQDKKTNNFHHFAFISSLRTGKISKIMPRDKFHIAALKEQKLKNRMSGKKSKFPPGEMYLCVLGNGSVSSSRALLMFTDHSRYLFNCGEGTQRLAQEHKTKLSKLENIFITHKSWENIGGLLGMSLTVQDVGIPEISLHGPSDLDLLFKQTEQFIILKDMKIVTNEIAGTFQDHCMEVKKIPIFKKSSFTPSLTCPDGEVYTSSSSNDSTSDEQAKKKLRLSDQKSSSDVTIAYACKGHSKRGTLLLEKCVEYNVPVGPLLGELKNGKDVTLPCGKIVHSKDVVSPEQVCPLFLVVECPDESFIDPFVSEKEFVHYQENGDKKAALVVHFTPSAVLKSSKYQHWMQRFSSSTSHLVLNSDCGTLNSLAVHRMQHKLNLLHPNIFSLLHEKEEQEHTALNITDNVFMGRTLERYYLRPAKGLDRFFALEIDSKEFIEEATNSVGFSLALTELKSAISEKSTQIPNGDNYPIVAFLGTGSSIPSKERNVSAILINTSEDKYILLDCGEGTYGQLLRLFGDKIESILLQLSCVFISHIHADHHLGLIKVLKEREKVFSKQKKEYQTVSVIGPRKIRFWLKDFSRTFLHLSHLYRFIECSSLQYDLLNNLHCKMDIENTPDLSISTVPVIHCQDSHAVIVSSKSLEWKLAYSGDTIPCKRLIQAGKDCSLLIHEASMEDELAEEAALKRHSTTGQAIEVAEEMNAQYTLLTHFSQRYAKVPLFSEKFHSKIGCAFDNLKVSPKEFYILPLLLPALNCLFAEHVEEMHTKGEKRKLRTEILKSIEPSIQIAQ